MDDRNEKIPEVSRTTQSFTKLLDYCNSCVNEKASVTIRVRRTYTQLCEGCADLIKDGLNAVLPQQRDKRFKNLNVSGSFCHGAQTDWCKTEKSRCIDCPLLGKGDIKWPHG